MSNSDEYSKLTNKEFKALKRNSEGDVIELSEYFFRLKSSQVELLTNDDSSRYEEYDEELRCLLAEASAEFA